MAIPLHAKAPEVYDLEAPDLFFGMLRTAMAELDDDSPVAAAAGLDASQLAALAADGLLAMDDGELFLESRHEEQLTFEDGRLKVAGRESRSGLRLSRRRRRACRLSPTGDRLRGAGMREAVAAVQAVAGGHSGRDERGARRTPGPSLYGGG